MPSLKLPKEMTLPVAELGVGRGVSAVPERHRDAVPEPATVRRVGDDSETALCIVFLAKRRGISGGVEVG